MGISYSYNFLLFSFRRMLLSFMLLPCCCMLMAQEEAQLTQAAEAYSNSNFEEAIQLYEQVLANGWEAFEVYYNLGNAYYKTDQIAPAILNYERAARINPTDEDLQHNLNMARNRTVDRIEMLSVPQFVNGYKAFVNNLSSDSWGTISIFSFFLALAAILIFLLIPTKWIKQLTLGLLLLFIGLSTVSFLFGWQQKQWLNANNEGIIFQASIEVQSTPDENGQELFVLHQGTKVRIVENFKDFVRIRIGDGKTGWINKQAIQEI